MRPRRLDGLAIVQARAMHALTRTELLRLGWTPGRITAGVLSGVLLRPRRGWYLPADAPRELIEAVRVGGLLGCVSLLRLLGVFVFDRPALHVHMRRGSSRMRSPGSRSPLAPREARGIVLHWHALVDEPTADRVGIVDALVHAVRCQPARHAIATLDSALNTGLLRLDRLGEVFAALPLRYGVLRAFVDGRAQSGPETLMRLMLRGLGCDVELQVRLVDVGYVDLLVDGWLVIECDSKLYHSAWEQQLKDHRRDLALAQQGYGVLRLTAEDIMYRPEAVLAAVRGLLASRAAR